MGVLSQSKYDGGNSCDPLAFSQAILYLLGSAFFFLCILSSPSAHAARGAPISTTVSPQHDTVRPIRKYSLLSLNPDLRPIGIGADSSDGVAGTIPPPSQKRMSQTHRFTTLAVVGGHVLRGEEL